MSDSIADYVGLETPPRISTEPVEPGAVRRFAQAIMDEDPIYAVPCDGNSRFGGPVAPLLFPAQMFRREFGDPDPIRDRAGDPDFDGLGVNATQGLPPIKPLMHLAALNGGSELEFFRHVRHGETVTSVARYADIYERETSKGPMTFVVIEVDYRGEDGALIMRSRRTEIRR